MTPENRKLPLPKTILPFRLAERKLFIDNKGFAVIRAKGDQALFGLNTAMMKRRVGAPEKRPLADFLSTLAIKAKDFAAEMTSVNVQHKRREYKKKY